MKLSDKITEELISFLETNNFQYSMEYNPSKIEILEINKQIKINKGKRSNQG